MRYLITYKCPRSNSRDTEVERFPNMAEAEEHANRCKGSYIVESIVTC